VRLGAPACDVNVLLEVGVGLLLVLFFFLFVTEMKWDNDDTTAGRRVAGGVVVDAVTRGAGLRTFGTCGRTCGLGLRRAVR
jgi:hypothetical protein